MNLNHIRCSLVVALTLLIAVSPAAAQIRGLRILIVAGEDAVNVIQQKTAVAPIVEVRDLNGQPVAGAVVKFAVRGGRASFNGARAVSVTTNAAGRAAVTSLTPTGSGAFQITASATFQGQTATVSIAQANVMTAVQAAEAATIVNAGASGAAAGGGGLSTIAVVGIVGGAVAGGAVAATQVLGSGGGIAIYEGPFRIDTVSSVRHTRGDGIVSLSCTATLSQIGEVRAEIEEREDGTITGTISAHWNATELSRTCPFSSGATDRSFGTSAVTGTSGAFRASSELRDTEADGVGFDAQSFSGTLRDGVITGTWTLGPGGYRTFPSANGFYAEALSPAGSVVVTLTK